jgi:ABC-type lipoprotein export system ATPase subunit
MANIEVKSVERHYGLVKAVDKLSATFEAGKQYAIRGSSGSGKSTLLYLLAGLDRPTAGQILVDGKDLSSFSDEALAKYRNRSVGLVFQFHFLLPSMNCLNNILLPAKIGNAKVDNVKENCIELAKALGVEHCLKKFPFEISGGEQQRINIIRALSLRPKYLFCDEPTGNLDSENSLKVVALLKELSKAFEATLIVVTHDKEVAEHFDHGLLFKDGRVESAY